MQLSLRPNYLPPSSASPFTSYLLRREKDQEKKKIIRELTDISRPAPKFTFRLVSKHMAHSDEAFTSVFDAPENLDTQCYRLVRNNLEHGENIHVLDTWGKESLEHPEVKDAYAVWAAAEKNCFWG